MKIDWLSLGLKRNPKIYVIGIKGSGTAALACLLNEFGAEVLGSDTKEKFFTDKLLEKQGIQFFEKFNSQNLPKDVDLVLYSTAYNEKNNIEIEEAKKREVLLMSYPEILGKIFNQNWGLAVCGTHGKTTVSAMLAHVLKISQKDPSAIVGSQVKNWESNFLAGKGELMVIEADEYQNKFKYYDPKAVVLTSLDWDHPDFFSDFESYKQAFSEFISKIPKTGFLTVWGDSTETLKISSEISCEIIKYGLAEDNDLKIIDKGTQKTKQAFEAIFKEESLGEFKINLFGKHNILNAGAVIATGLKLGIEIEKIKEGLRDFQGTSRRMEFIGERNGSIIFDDYGHHPEEIKATLRAFRNKYTNKKITAVFHPHSFSRTQALLEDFAQSFDDADSVLVLDIYGSARENKGEVSSKDLVDLINKYDKQKAFYVPTIKKTLDFLKEEVGENDLIITIGAGNVFEVAKKLTE